MKGLPIGVDDFKKIRDGDGYYVDKTALIDHILQRNMVEAFLFTRPRRFGKSLNLSMLDAYLNQDYSEDHDRFEGLRVTELRPNDPEKNSNVVVSMSLKNLGCDTYENFIGSFSLEMRRLYRDFLVLRNSEKLDDSSRQFFESVYMGTDNQSFLKGSLLELCSMLEMHYSKKVILLIDEYDYVSNTSFGSGDNHAAIMSFMRMFLGSALKSNPSLRFAVITGVMKISKESIFSGLNNLEVNDVFSSEFGEMYGFTPDEVMDICSYYGHPEKYSEVKEWYDGYRFGDSEIYNPWSVLKYVGSGFEPDEYWAGTSGNSILGDLVARTDSETWTDLERLMAGDSVETGLDRNISYGDLISSSSAMYSVMVMSGYLNAVRTESGYAVSIPNLEMRQVFSRAIMDRFGSGLNGLIFDLIGFMKSGDVSGMTDVLKELMEILSVRILKGEYPYEAFIAGLMAIEGRRYRIQVDHEAGNGMFDIRMERMSGTGPNICLELKRRNKSNSTVPMDVLADRALAQIRDQDYTRGLSGRTMIYGIAFDKKDPTIRMDVLDGTV